MTSTKNIRFRRFLIFGGASLLVISTGCGLFETHKKPNIETVPPYYEHGEKPTDYHSYHEQERKNMANQVHIVRNREMERLAKSEKDDKANNQWEEETKATQEKREKFWNKFKVGDQKFMRSDEAARISANLDR